jgi:hypothetical protein
LAVNLLSLNRQESGEPPVQDFRQGAGWSNGIPATAGVKSGARRDAQKLKWNGEQEEAKTGGLGRSQEAMWVE